MVFWGYTGAVHTGSLYPFYIKYYAHSFYISYFVVLTFRYNKHMPWYNDLRPDDDDKKNFELFPNFTQVEKKRCIRNLLQLRDKLQEEIAPKIADQNILVASWNIREFGHLKKRLPEVYFYIAEIINRFDLIAVQEVKSGLGDLNLLMRLLGTDWDYMINDITEGKPGNSERSAYIYNKKRVQLAGIAGEISLHADLVQDSEIKQLKRSPYITGFVAGWKKFSLINLHLHPSSSQADVAYRREEVRLLIKAIKEKLDNKRFWNENVILVGDFNFYAGDNKDNQTVQMLYDAGFKEIAALLKHPTNSIESDTYDRIFFHVNEYFKIGKDKDGNEVGGVFNPFIHIFRDVDLTDYSDVVKAQYGGSRDLEVEENLMRYYRYPWRVNQLSDHFPIWAEIEIDSSDDFLTTKLMEFGE